MSTPLKILIVDDDVEMRAYLSLALKSLGHQILSRSTPSIEGLPQVDLVLVDLLFRPGNSLKLLKHLKVEEIPHILLTGLRPDAALFQEALRGGLEHYLLKPFTLDQLFEAVDQSSKGSRVQR